MHAASLALGSVGGSAFSGASCVRARAATVSRRGARALRLAPVAVGWDPENILAGPQEGHIARRQYSKKLVSDAAFLQQEERRLAKVQAETAAAREARVVPQDNPKALVEFLLNTDAQEMTFEVARVRPQLHDAFFAYLTDAIRGEKFNARSNTERVAELEGLQEMLLSSVKKLDEDTQRLSAPSDRLRKLLNAPDKRAMILTMAGDNEFDADFFNLLDQNILGAQDAGQAEASAFMVKLRDACQKWRVPA